MDTDSNAQTIKYRSIGVIHTSFHKKKGMPIQPMGAETTLGTVDVFEEYAEGLADLEGFSHVILLYHFHQAGPTSLRVVPFMDTEYRGVFATRAPVRPNAIGLSIVKLESVEGSRLTISGVDILDGTPLLDIKPYVPAFDYRENVRTGWLESLSHKVRKTRADNRFVPEDEGS